MPQSLAWSQLEQAVDVHRLVRAVEAADAEMHDADTDLVAVIARLGDRDSRQRLVVELHDTVTTDLTVPGTRSESSASAAFSTANGSANGTAKAWSRLRQGPSLGIHRAI